MRNLFILLTINTASFITLHAESIDFTLNHAMGLAETRLVQVGVNIEKYKIESQEGEIVLISPIVDKDILPSRDGGAWIFVPKQGKQIDYRFDGYGVRSIELPAKERCSTEIARRILQKYNISESDYFAKKTQAYKFSLFARTGVEKSDGRCAFVDVDTPLVFVLNNPRMAIYIR